MCALLSGIFLLGGTGAALASYPQVVDEQNGLQVSGTTAETVLYSYLLPGNTLTPDSGGRRAHMSVTVHLSNGDINDWHYNLNVYFGSRKIGNFYLFLQASGNASIQMDVYFHTSTFLGQQYLSVEMAALQAAAFSYDGVVQPTGLPPFTGEVLLDVPVSADPSQPNALTVKVALPTGDGRTYAVLGHGMTILE